MLAAPAAVCRAYERHPFPATLFKRKRQLKPAQRLGNTGEPALLQARKGIRQYAGLNELGLAGWRLEQAQRIGPQRLEGGALAPARLGRTGCQALQPRARVQ